MINERDGMQARQLTQRKATVRVQCRKAKVKKGLKIYKEKNKRYDALPGLVAMMVTCIHNSFVGSCYITLVVFLCAPLFVVWSGAAWQVKRAP